MSYKLPFKSVNVQTPKRSEPESDYTSSIHWQDVVKQCINNISYFGRLCRPQIYDYPSAEIHSTFDAWAIDSSITHGIIEVYRGSAKSTKFAEDLPLWHTYCEPFLCADFYPKSLKELVAFLKTQPGVLVSIQSQSGSHARDRINGIKTPLGAKDLIKDNEKMGITNFRIHFGNVKIGSSTQAHLKTDRGAYISLGGKQQAHGLNIDSIRPTLFIIDDPETEDNTLTLDATEKTFNKLMNGTIAGKDPKGRGFTLFTPLPNKCFGRRVMNLAKAGMPGWKYLYHPLVSTKKGIEVSAWNERFPINNVLAERKAMEKDGTVHLWYQKYQCVLTSRRTQLFKPEDIMLYDGKYFKGDNGYWYLKITHKGPYTEYDKNSPFELEEPEIVPITFHTGHDPSHGVGHNNACKFTHGYDGTNRYAYQILLRNDVDIYGQCLWLIQGSDEDGIDGYDTLQEESITVEGNFFEKAMERVLDDVCFDKNIYLPISVNNPRISKDEKYKSSIVGDFKRHRMWFLRKHKTVINIFTSYSTIQQNQEDDPIDGLYLSRHESYAPLHTISELKPRHEKKPSRSKASTRRSADSWKTTSPIR